MMYTTGVAAPAIFFIYLANQLKFLLYEPIPPEPPVAEELPPVAEEPPPVVEGPPPVAVESEGNGAASTNPAQAVNDAEIDAATAPSDFTSLVSRATSIEQLNKIRESAQGFLILENCCKRLSRSRAAVGYHMCHRFKIFFANANDDIS
ncbi:MAG: hypothetical protein LBC42_00745, partial [Puniceicoccales bacterium]|nr:hypothetical protein [Puniceicoccales bacterium]